MPSISVTTLFNFSRMKATFSEAAEYKNFNMAAVVLMPMMLSIGETIKTFLLYTGLYVFLLTLGLVAKGVGTWGKMKFRNYRH